MTEYPQDQVLCFHQSEYVVMVDGKIYGTWDSLDVAEIGLLVEQRRAAKRKLENGAADAAASRL